MRKTKRSKELKSLEIFKKGFKKNEIIIYAIALMLVTAGYFNYSTKLDGAALPTYSDNVTQEQKSNVNENITKDEKNIAKQQKIASNREEPSEKEEGIGDAKLVNSNEVSGEKKEESETTSDYFKETKLQRDTTYADMISTYTKILEDKAISEPQKAIAMKEITKINDTKNAIAICENIISTKGFNQYVVLINNDSVNAVVKVDGGLNKSKIAQLQNIISRELNCQIENIHITEK